MFLGPAPGSAGEWFREGEDWLVGGPAVEVFGEGSGWGSGLRDFAIALRQMASRAGSIGGVDGSGAGEPAILDVFRRTREIVPSNGTLPVSSE